ncbi:DUF4336 domain-containing protein [Lyngbya confervoides]|uniref:DUF4336 domain-containing protein n=1 Tax=Lyngbya confervoides BDU141951 TaxID=1574623 RepID=A0ABD4T1W9_9CYAN|nr:DUF4336 domain-containing protein [Lyngbya confervoides]MCM1982582.1 DUF4336 domain-containing protein [Lyngbya confervoides BDU141951]
MPDNFRSPDYAWSLWPLLPLYPYGQRRTLRREVVPRQIWVFEQIQGIFYVVTPVRMTVIRLQAGGLLVYAPVAPTRECRRLLADLEAEHGAVKYIILPTASGLEHKVFVGPFARQCPEATVYVTPAQWSFPLNLPLNWLGFPKQRTQVLPSQSHRAPFGEEFDYEILQDVDLRLGYFQEVALFHRATQSLLVTDSIVSIPTQPPEVVQLNPYPLLFHAKQTAADPIRDTPAHRVRGWQRIALFSFYFRPHALQVKGVWQTLRESWSASDRSAKAYFGLYPFDWQETWQESFERLSGGGRILVAPILQTLILNRSPAQTLVWVNRIAQWPILRIIPCHLDAPIAATGSQFQQAFSFLRKDANIADPKLPGASLPAADIQFLQNLDQGLLRSGITPPAQEKL